MSHKYPLGTILRSIDKQKLYIVASCKNTYCPCEDCAFSSIDCYNRIPEELGIEMKQYCKNIFGENVVLEAIEGGL